MPRVLIHMLREHGHLLPTLKLARSLTRAGHEVEYLLTPSWRGFAREHGVVLRTHLESIYPEGSELAWARMSAEERQRDYDARFQRRAEYLRGGGLVEEYRRLRPDLVLGDPFDVSIPLAAHAAGVRAVLLSPTLFQGRWPGVPPITTSLGPGVDQASREAADQAWRRLHAERRARGDEDWYPGYVEALVTAHRFPRSQITWEAAIAPDFPGLPVLVLCPRALEFPGALPARCHYDVASLLARGEEVDEALAAWLARAPLVYCAFGTQAMWRPGYRRLYDEVLALARRRPELSVLVATGEAWREHYAARAPENVKVVGRAPQHAVLRAARLMISVGGLGTIKECAWLGVPMIVLPRAEGHDPPGNAARLRAHGVARVLDPVRADAEALEREVDALLRGENDAAVGRLQRAFAAAEEGSSRGVELVERALEGRL